MFKSALRRLRVRSSRQYLEKFVRDAGNSVPEGANVLDAGAGDAPYRNFFSHTHYETADFCEVDKPYYSDITYVCDLRSVPVQSGRYDLILLTQVLEHCPEPKDVLQEMFRLLKPGGIMWLSAPLFYEEHETPYDFYRYTQFGFRYLLEQAGFSILSINWLEGYYGTLAYQLEFAARHLQSRPESYGGGLRGYFFAIFSIFLRPLFKILAHYFASLDNRIYWTKSGMCKNYALVAQKPEAKGE